MSTSKFTAADVVVGATVHIRETTKHKVTVTTVDYRGVATRVTENGTAWIVADGGNECAFLRDRDRTTVEILDVVAPKPKYVTGGIYRATIGVTYLRQRFADGWGHVGSKTSSGDAHFGDWTIGDRVLVIDYPDDRMVSDAKRGALLTDAGKLVQKALREEADRGVTS